jgi:hypothetical protein
MGDQLSGLQEQDKAGSENHAKRYPLDGIKEIAQEDVVKTGLTEKRNEELDCASGCESESRCIARMVAMTELTEKDQSEKSCCDRCVEGDRMEADGVGWDSNAPWEGGGKAGVAAFGEVSQSEEGPDQRGARGPCVQRVEKREMTEAEVNSRNDCGEEKAGGGERRHHQQKDGVAEEAVQVGEDQKKAREDKGGEDGDEAGVPHRFGVEADGGGGAEAEGERSHESNRGEDTVGGKEKMTGVKEIGVHGRVVSRVVVLQSARERRPTRWAVRRVAGEPV